MLQVLVLKVSEREAPGPAVHPLPCRGRPVGTFPDGLLLDTKFQINNEKFSFRRAPCNIWDVLNKVIRCFSEIQIELGVLYSEPRGEGRSLKPSPTHPVRDRRRVSHRPLCPASAVCRPVPLPLRRAPIPVGQGTLKAAGCDLTKVIETTLLLAECMT